MSELSIKVSVSVSDGSFECFLSIPASATKEKFADLAATWMQMMQKAITILPQEQPKVKGE